MKLVVWVLSLNFLHVFTLFVIDIHKNMLPSLFPTPFGHFQFLGFAGQNPKLFLTLCLNQFWFISEVTGLGHEKGKLATTTRGHSVNLDKLRYLNKFDQFLSSNLGHFNQFWFILEVVMLGHKKRKIGDNDEGSQCKPRQVTSCYQAVKGGDVTLSTPNLCHISAKVLNPPKDKSEQSP